jgi:hypothetical protein
MRFQYEIRFNVLIVICYLFLVQLTSYLLSYVLVLVPQVPRHGTVALYEIQIRS